MISFTIDSLPVLPNRKGQGHHWSVEHRYRKAWHRAVRCGLGRQRPKEPLERARITLTRKSADEPDPDNLTASWKPVIDGLTVWGVIADDSSDHVEIDSRWAYAPRGKGSIEVRVEPLA